MTTADDTATAAIFARAVEHHRQGRIGEALTLYNAILRSAPDNAAVHCNRGIALQIMGRLDEALHSYEAAIRCRPGFADAYFNRAMALGVLHRPEEALEDYDLALLYKPDHLGAWRFKGNTLLELGRSDEALSCFERAAAIAPDSAIVQYDKANALRAQNRLLEALAGYERALALKPDFAEAHSNKANVLSELKRHEEALGSYDRAIEANPGLALTLVNRGKALESLNRPEDALASYDRAIALKPDYAEAFCNRGNAMHDLKRFNDALESYDRALAWRSDFAAARCAKGMCKLLLGNFAEGWPLYEWRPALEASERFSRPRPMRREDLDGKTIFVRAEQGLGDTIQFCRYALLARDLGARVVLSVQDTLVPLIATLDPGVTVIPRSKSPPCFDVSINLLSLPLAFGTDESTVPANIPYLFAERERVERWETRLRSTAFKVGICWQGSKESPSDFGRSFPLVCFKHLTQIPGVRLVSLQKHDGTEQLNGLPAGMSIETLGEDFDAAGDAFLDTAAVMDNLDLVITSETAIAHLAGALGRPVWLALKHVPDWRWQLDRSDSPWYPTMRLFRQRARGDWTGVFVDIEKELRVLFQENSTV